jgi:hypothetical protein
MSVFWQKVGFCPHSKKSWARQGSHRHNCGAAPRWTLAIGESSELAARGTRVYRTVYRVAQEPGVDGRTSAHAVDGVREAHEPGNGERWIGADADRYTYIWGFSFSQLPVPRRLQVVASRRHQSCHCPQDTRQVCLAG